MKERKWWCIPDGKLSFVVIWSLKYLLAEEICYLLLCHICQQNRMVLLVQLSQARPLPNGYFQKLFSPLSKLQKSIASSFVFARYASTSLLACNVWPFFQCQKDESSHCKMNCIFLEFSVLSGYTELDNANLSLIKFY